MYWLELYIKNLSQKRHTYKKFTKEITKKKKKKNQIIFGGMGTKVENAASDEERIMVSLFLVMSTTQVDKLNGWSSKRLKKKKKTNSCKIYYKNIMNKGFLGGPRWQK